jgi:hypothetical protein
VLDLARSAADAAALAVVPGHKATVLVAFAGMGAMPVKSSAGNDMKLPPPATELMVPPRSAAKNKKMG